MMGLSCRKFFALSKIAAPCQLHLGNQNIFGFCLKHRIWYEDNFYVPQPSKIKSIWEYF